MKTPIYVYDSKQLFRNKTFLVLTTLLLLTGIYAIFYGNNEIKQQKRKIALLTESVNKNNKAFLDNLQKKDTVASEAGEFSGRVHANPPNGITSLALGVRDIHKFVQHITNGSFFYNKYATGYYNKTQSSEIVNPFKLLSGHFDLSFVLLLLFPLYLILVSYNLYSNEQETGTLSLLCIQPISLRNILVQKMFLRVLITVLCGIALFLVVCISDTSLVDNLQFWLFILGFILYIFLWSSIIFFFISFRKSSGFNALGLISMWLVFIILIPSLANAIINSAMPVKTKTALSRAVQKGNADFFALDQKVRTDSFRAIKPQYQKSFDSIGGWSDPKFWRASHSLVDHLVLPYEKERIETIERRINLSDKLNYLSPTLIMQSVFTELAASGLNQALEYDTCGWKYFRMVSDFTDHYIFFNNNRMNKEQFLQMPSFEFKPQIQYSKITFQLGLITLLSSIIFTLGWVRLNKSSLV